MSKRTFRLKTGSNNFGDVIYWMSRDQRVSDNWALIEAYNESLKRKVQLFVVFTLADSFLGAGNRQFDFMIKGIKEVAVNLQKLNIHFVLLRGNPPDVLADYINKGYFSTVFTDFDPLRIKRNWKLEFSQKTDITIYETDAHNIVPCRIASEKLEFAAYTIRPKIKRLLNEYLTEIPEIELHPFNTDVDNTFPEIDSFQYSNEPNVSISFLPGENEAQNRLKYFINNRLYDYSGQRNEPSENFQSDLSPYLHFGQISAQRIALEVSNADSLQQSKDDYLEELIIRRELSDNYCFHNSDYDNFSGFHEWAMKSLSAHINDKREFIYTLEQFELSQTHDIYWNAAQSEMVKTGKMHGYMRMYWAKKILEWTESPHQALEFAIYLNDKYQLDGRDPNGYTGIAWSIGGVHDRPWSERPIFGKIRYMNAQGLKRKFQIDKYVNKVNLL